MNNLQNRQIVPNRELAEFLKTDENLDPLAFTSLLWKRLYQSGAVRYEDGTRALRRRRRERSKRTRSRR